MRPRIYLLRFGVGWAEWVWELPGMRVSGFDTMADAADDARVWVSDHTNGSL